MMVDERWSTYHVISYFDQYNRDVNLKLSLKSIEVWEMVDEMVDCEMRW